MKKITLDMVTVSVNVIPEFENISDILSFERTGVDHSEYINHVIQDGGANPWLWGSVEVTVELTGFSELSASEYLGCVTYESKEDFVKDSGYYDSMVSDALDALNAKVQKLSTIIL